VYTIDTMSSMNHGYVMPCEVDWVLWSGWFSRDDAELSLSERVAIVPEVYNSMRTVMIEMC